MQLLRGTTNSAAKASDAKTARTLVESAASELVSGVPPVIWFIRTQMRPHRKGLSLQQFRALVLVDRHPEASLSDIAEQLAASLPTTSRLIAGLVAKGMVARKGCSDDRRQLELAITKLGREMLDSAWAGVQKKVEQELAPLSEAQLKTLQDAMNTLQSVFGSLELPDRQNSHHRPREKNGQKNGERARPLQRAAK